MENDFDFDFVRAALAREIQRQGIAPTTLSQMVGKSKSLVKEILEEGRDIKLSTLVRLANALKIDVSELLPAQPTGTVLVPLALPNLTVLTSMFRSLLAIDPDETDADVRARTLARHFPGIFQAHLSHAGRAVASSADIAGSPPHAGDEDRPSNVQ